MIWTMIGLMAVVVFTSRYLFIEPKLPLKLSANARHFLSYSAPAVLSAIIAPVVFFDGNQLNLSVNNPYLLCSSVAAALALLTRNTLITVIISMALFFMIN